jgi:SAM-dependent methyltransferase
MAPILPLAGLEVLACPKCGSGLAGAREEVQCQTCGGAWPVRQGVVCFGQSAAFPRDFSPAQTAELLQIAERSGWQVALHDHMRALDPVPYRHAVDAYRAQWQCLLPLTPQCTLLDLRCGWGPIAVNLAPNAGRVVAADTCYETARFTGLRAEAMGYRHMHPVCLDPVGRLPFAAGAFDGVILHDVVEWLPPDRLLREAARVLAPGGWVFVNAANQLSLGHVLQSGQAPASRSPRPRPMTLGGYRRALRLAGFQGQSVFALLPSVAEPFYIVSLSHPSALKYLLDSLFDSAGLRLALAKRNLLGPFRLAQALWRTGRFLPVEYLAQHLVPGYGLLARRAAG